MQFKLEMFLMAAPAMLFVVEYWVLGVILIAIEYHLRKEIFVYSDFDSKVINRILILAVFGVLIGLFKGYKDGLVALAGLMIIPAFIIVTQPISDHIEAIDRKGKE